jgi:hypothetical protein
VAFLEKAFPKAHEAGGPQLFYALDNEPDLWNSTHARIHPKAITYEELCKNNLEYAGAIKAVAPKALVFGFVSYGYMGFTTLQNAPDAKGRNVLDVYLDALAGAEKSAGKRVIDVLDLHWYPEAQGDKKRIIDDGSSAGLVAARVQAPRSLWDPTYKENSWITNDVTHKPLALIPEIRGRIEKHYPGTKLAFTEYYYGGGDHISGGVAEADALGIFAREGVFAAAIWHVGNSKDAFIYAAMQMYLNYDGKGAKVGETGLEAGTSDVGASSVYAFKDEKGVVTVVAINKTDKALPAEVVVKGAAGKSAAVYQLTAEKAEPKGAGTVAVEGGRMKVELPAMSVTTVVVGK